MSTEEETTKEAHSEPLQQHSVIYSFFLTIKI